jgi:hypothetical protein
VLALVSVLSLSSAAARADDEVAPPFSDDPDSDAAKRHFRLGLDHYNEARFVDAIREFDLARQLKPSPAFDYNIGRCHERLEQWGLAADAYTRYLAAEPRAPNAAQLRARLDVLRARAQLSGLSADLAAVELARTQRRQRIAAWTVGGITVALAAGGLGAYLSPLSDYHRAQNDCRGGCSPEALAGLNTKVNRAEIAAAALWGASGAALLVDVVLWTTKGRATPSRERRP